MTLTAMFVVFAGLTLLFIAFLGIIAIYLARKKAENINRSLSRSTENDNHGLISPEIYQQLYSWHSCKWSKRHMVQKVTLSLYVEWSKSLPHLGTQNYLD